MITQLIQRQALCETDMLTIGQLIAREFLRVIGVHRKYLMQVHGLHKKRNSFQKALCDRCPV